MSGVTLVGHSTRLNQEGLFGEEKYVIDSVSKLAGETWLIFTAPSPLFFLQEMTADREIKIETKRKVRLMGFI